jgi:hypothetical protein
MNRFDQSIYATRPYLSSLACSLKGCVENWTSQWLSSNAFLVQRFLSTLAARSSATQTNLAHGALVCKQVFPTLGVNDGEVITTPFACGAAAYGIIHSIVHNVFAGNLLRNCSIQERDGK